MFRNIYIFFLMISNTTNCFSEKIVSYYQESQIPIFKLESLDCSTYCILKELNVDDLPKTANWQANRDYHKNRNRKVYLTPDKKFVVKIWQKKYPSTVNFLAALKAGFYDGIAKISGLIFDEEDECRGYISPYMTDRTYNRHKWDIFGFKVEKGDINVKIFSIYDKQPKMYQDLYDALIKNAKKSAYASLDFCPDNIAVDDGDNNAYLVDLEDVQPVEMLKNELIARVFFVYNPRDYLEQLTDLIV
jgi:hypothetical protein